VITRTTDSQNQPAILLTGRYIRWVATRKPETLRLAITAAITAAVVFSVDHGVPAIWGAAFPDTPTTRFVTFKPVIGGRLPHGFGFRKGLNGPCYRVSVRSDSSQALSCLDPRGGIHAPCFLPPPATPDSTVFACYDEPWEYPIFIGASAVRPAPAAWKAAMRHDRPSSVVGLVLANSERCVASPYPQLEIPPNPDGTTYMCRKQMLPVALPINANNVDGFIYGSPTQGRVWQANYIPIGDQSGSPANVRVVWIG
jgi:hypothetical protein